MVPMSLFALNFKAEVRQGPTHKAFQSFPSFPKRRVPRAAGSTGFGEGCKAGNASPAGVFLGLWVPRIFRLGSRFEATWYSLAVRWPLPTQDLPHKVKRAHKCFPSTPTADGRGGGEIRGVLS